MPKESQPRKVGTELRGSEGQAEDTADARGSAAAGHLPARLRRGLLTLLVAAFAVELAVSVVRLAIQFLGIKYGASPMVLGLYGTVSAGIYGLMSLAAGHASDRFGRRLAGVFVALMAVVWLIIGAQRSAYTILLLLPVFAAMLAYFWSPVQAWVGDLVGEARDLNTTLGSFNVLWTTGLMVGPVVCGYLWERSVYAPFVAGTAIALATAAALMTVPAVQRPGEDPSACPDAAVGKAESHGGPAARPSTSAMASDPRADLLLPVAWVANLACYSSVGIVRALFPKLGIDLHFSEVTIGWVSFAFYAGQLAAFAAMRQIGGWHYRRLPLVGAAAVGSAGMAWAYLARSPLTFALAFVVAGAAVGFAYVASLFYSLSAPPARRGLRAGISELTVGAGAALGPLVAGAVSTYWGVRASFGVQSLVLGVAVVALALWSLRRRP